jgi:hypothetical protein
MSTVAIKKRMAMSQHAGATSSVSLMMTNDAPQMTAQESIPIFHAHMGAVRMSRVFGMRAIIRPENGLT